MMSFCQQIGFRNTYKRSDFSQDKYLKISAGLFALTSIRVPEETEQRPSRGAVWPAFCKEKVKGRRKANK